MSETPELASRNAIARECADLRDQLAHTVEELTAAREDAAHQFVQRCVEATRAADAEQVVRTARNLLSGSTGPGHTNRRQELADALTEYDARSRFVYSDVDGAGVRHLADVLLAYADRMDAEAEPADPGTPGGSQTDAQGQPGGDLW